MTATLQEIVITAMAERGLSFREAAKRAGGRPSWSTFHAIARGKTRWIDDATAAGLAAAFERPIEEIRAANGRAPTVPTPFRLPPEADNLDPRERKVVVEMVHILLAAHRQSP